MAYICLAIISSIKLLWSKRIRCSPEFLAEKAMAPHSSTLAWKIPWTEEPGRLQSMGLLVGHNWVTSLSLFTFTHWRRKWQPTPVFLPGESQGRGSLVGCHLWGRTESTRLKRLSSSSRVPGHRFLWYHQNYTSGLAHCYQQAKFCPPPVFANSSIGT